MKLTFIEWLAFVTSINCLADVDTTFYKINYAQQPCGFIFADVAQIVNAVKRPVGRHAAKTP